MIAVVLMVVKILAWILLAAVGLLLLAVLLLLMVPIRYRLEGTYRENLRVMAELSWMFHVWNLTMEYRDGMQVQLKFFGKPFFSSEEELPEEEPPGKGPLKKEWDTEPEFQADEGSESEIQEETEPEFKTEVESEARTAVESENRTEPKPDTARKTEPDTEQKTGADVSRESAADLLKRKCLAGLQRVRRKIQAIGRSYQRQKKQVSESLGKLFEKKEQILDFIRNEENQKTFRLLKAELVRLWRHIRPRRISGYLRFGFDDPYYTGMVLAYVSPFYGIYAESLDLIPVFEEQVLEGDWKLRGRLRLSILLWCILRVCLDKNFRRLYRKFRNHE